MNHHRNNNHRHHHQNHLATTSQPRTTTTTDAAVAAASSSGRRRHLHHHYRASPKSSSGASRVRSAASWTQAIVLLTSCLALTIATTSTSLAKSSSGDGGVGVGADHDEGSLLVLAGASERRVVAADVERSDDRRFLVKRSANYELQQRHHHRHHHHHHNHHNHHQHHHNTLHQNLRRAAHHPHKLRHHHHRHNHHNHYNLHKLHHNHPQQQQQQQQQEEHDLHQRQDVDQLETAASGLPFWETAPPLTGSQSSASEETVAGQPLGYGISGSRDSIISDDNWRRHVEENEIDTLGTELLDLPAAAAVAGADESQPIQILNQFDTTTTTTSNNNFNNFNYNNYNRQQVPEQSPPIVVSFGDNGYVSASPIETTTTTTTTTTTIPTTTALTITSDSESNAIDAGDSMMMMMMSDDIIKMAPTRAREEPRYSNIIQGRPNHHSFGDKRHWHDSHHASIHIGREQYEEYRHPGDGSPLKGALIAIVFGIGATGMLIAIVGHKMKSIRKRIAYKGRRRSLVPNADFLINTLPI